MKKDNITIIGIEGNEKAIADEMDIWENNPYYDNITRLIIPRTDTMDTILKKIQLAHEECSLVRIINPKLIANGDGVTLTLLYSLPHASKESDHTIVCVEKGDASVKVIYEDFKREPP